jgi:hypothetical protein
MTRRFGELDFAGAFQTAVQEDPLRRCVTWVRVGTDRFNAECPVAVIDDGGNGFTSIPVAPIGLGQPIAERRFFTFALPRPRRTGEPPTSTASRGTWRQLVCL